jgi:DNA-binding transcriptional ArsR family regulator
MTPLAAGTLADVLDSAFLRALAEPSRLDVLKVMLAAGPSDVGTIAAHLPLERTVVSRHLKVLHDAGIVAVERVGRRRVYALDGQAILARFEIILDRAREVAAVCCPPRAGAAELVAPAAARVPRRRRAPRRRRGR